MNNNSDLETKVNTNYLKPQWQRALELAQLGFSITSPIPQGNNRKHPRWKYKHLRDKPATPGDIFNWAINFPTDKYGIITGVPSGIVVIEADDQAAKDYIRDHCPATPMLQLSASVKRSEHHLYRYLLPEGWSKIPSRQGITIRGTKYKLDVRADGGLIVGPCSWRNETGLSYDEVTPWTGEMLTGLPLFDPSWIEYDPPTEDERRHTDPPDNLNCASSVPLSMRQEKAREWLLGLAGCTEGQGADNRCFALAIGLLWGWDLTIDEAFPLLYEWGQREDQLDKHGGWYGWSDAEIWHKLQDAEGKEDKEGRPRGFLAARVPSVSYYEQKILAQLGQNGKLKNKVDISEIACDNKLEPTKQEDKLLNTGYVFAPMTCAELDAKSYRMEWIVPNLLVYGQPCIFGGSKKTLKTSMLVDLALGIGTGTEFLGHWPVERPRRCLLISGESGGFTIQETMRRIAKEKRIDPKMIENAMFDFKLPHLSVPLELHHLGQGLRKLEIEVVIIDPLYLCLLSGNNKGRERDARNLYDMGELLSNVAEICLSEGATPILCHHARKSQYSQSFDELDLDDLAYGGVAEFARQWLLVSRRKKYEHNGFHELWLVAGGSCGHGGRWALEITDGKMLNDFGGRKWNVDVMTGEQAKAKKENMKKEEKTQKDDKDTSALLELLDKEKAVSKNQINLALGFNWNKINKTIEQLGTQVRFNEQKLLVRT